MTELLTESFCERCGTRYTFEVARPRGAGTARLRALSKGLRTFISNDDTSFTEAMAAARSDQNRAVAAQQMDAFHRTFNFCFSCRQYTCADCWNQAAGTCLSCTPVEADQHERPARHAPDRQAAPSPAASAGPAFEALTTDEDRAPARAEPATAGTSATTSGATAPTAFPILRPSLEAVAWPRADLTRRPTGAGDLVGAGGADVTAEVPRSPGLEEPESPAAEVLPTAAEAPAAPEPAGPELAGPGLAVPAARVSGEPPAGDLTPDELTEIAQALATGAPPEADAVAEVGFHAVAPEAVASEAAAPEAVAPDRAPVEEQAIEPEAEAAGAVEPGLAILAPAPGEEADVAPAEEPVLEPAAEAAGALEPEPEPVAQAAAEPDAALGEPAESSAGRAPDAAERSAQEATLARSRTRGLLARYRPSGAPQPAEAAPARAAQDGGPGQPPTVASRPEAPVEPSVVAATPEEPPVAAEAAAPAEPVEAARSAESGPEAETAEPVDEQAGTPAPASRDTVAQPVWTIVAPDTPDATPPRWTPQPRSSGRQLDLPSSAWAARLATARPEDIWAISSEDVLAGGSGAPAPTVHPCVQCGLSLSSNARFCRRCGARQR